MADPHTHRSLLDELDERQNELLDELDGLNRKIELVIAEWTQRPDHELPAEKAA